MFSRKLIKEYQQIMKEEHGVDMIYTEAHEQATNLVNYFKVLMKM